MIKCKFDYKAILILTLMGGREAYIPNLIRSMTLLFSSFPFYLSTVFSPLLLQFRFPKRDIR